MEKGFTKIFGLGFWKIVSPQLEKMESVHLILRPFNKQNLAKTTFYLIIASSLRISKHN